MTPNPRSDSQYEFSRTDLSTGWYGAWENQYEDDEVEPGVLREGIIVFEVAEDDADGTLTFIVDPVRADFDTVVRWTA